MPALTDSDSSKDGVIDLARCSCHGLYLTVMPDFAKRFQLFMGCRHSFTFKKLSLILINLTNIY